jgi:DNA-binding PadR family transcriptional regulator
MEQYDSTSELDALILATMAGGSSYGYAIIDQLKVRAGEAFQVPEGSVYPALHRLERQKLLASDWSMEAGRPRRVYRLTKRGEHELAARRAGGRGFGPSIDRGGLAT